VDKRLVQSNLLLLLFTDVAKSWDWCLYEAGLFGRLDNDHYRRVICLHSSSTTPPKPLQHLQAFAAEPSRLRVFLRQLLLGTELTGLESPIAPVLESFPDLLETASKQIAQLIHRRPIESRYFNRYVIIQVTDPAALQRGHIPRDAPIGSTGRSLELFELAEGNLTWGTLEDNARQAGDTRWIDELAAAIHAASRGNLPAPIQALFRPRLSQKVYGPMLYRVDRRADGSMIFKVLFADDCSWQLDRVPQDHAQLLTSLVMATRFRHELIAPYAGQLEDMNDDAAERTCEAITQIIHNVESEASSRGLMDQMFLSKAFSGRDRQLVQDMYGDWYRVRGNLMAALQERRLVEVDEALLKLARMNRTYLDVATRRYHEFVTSDELVAPSYETDPARVLRKPVNRETDGSTRSRCLEAEMDRIAEQIAPPPAELVANPSC
jgi:hypothetical protein